MVDDIAESGLAGQVFEIGVSVVADEAFSGCVDGRRRLRERLGGGGVCPVWRGAIADREFRLWANPAS